MHITCIKKSNLYDYITTHVTMSLPLLFTIGCVIVISLCSMAGTLLLTAREEFVSKAMIYLVSFATGAMLGIVFFHLLPEVMESSDPHIGSVLILLGVLLAFCIEKFIHWHHCHIVDHHDEEEGQHTHPMGSLIVIGDGIHNFIDGMLIASAFMVSIPLGIVTAIGIILHEVPQELSDIALLLHSGFSRGRAILWNTLSSCAAILGAVVAIVFAQWAEGIEFILLPIAAGNFLYIATTDLIPELHKETRLTKSLQQLALLVLGIALMAGLISMQHVLGGEDAHGHDEAVADEQSEHTEEPADGLMVRVLDVNGNPTDASMGVRVRVR